MQSRKDKLKPTHTSPEDILQHIRQFALESEPKWLRTIAYHLSLMLVEMRIANEREATKMKEIEAVHEKLKMALEPQHITGAGLGDPDLGKLVGKSD